MEATLAAQASRDPAVIRLQYMVEPDRSLHASHAGADGAPTGRVAARSTMRGDAALPDRRKGEHPEHRPNYKAPAVRLGPPQGAAAVAQHRTQVQLLSRQLHSLHCAAPARWTEAALAQHFDLPLGVVQACMCHVCAEGLHAY